MKEWQFNILFFVGVGGALLLVLGPEFGLKIGQNPTAVAGLGAILTYVLTQHDSLIGRKRRKKNEDPGDDVPEEEGEDGASG